MHNEQARAMAAYNRWMNRCLYAVSAELTEAERRQDRGVFFNSIHGTLNHILLADRVWMGRFLNKPFRVDSLDQELYQDFEALQQAREQTDTQIVQWANALTDETLAGTLHYRSVTGGPARNYDLWLAVTHFFNHQTHHRGQLTALLSQCGKDYGVTDLIQLPQVLDRNAS